MNEYILWETALSPFEALMANVSIFTISVEVVFAWTLYVFFVVRWNNY